MRIGIMQPYFFPYLGHFALIAHTDAWVVFDVTQYTPKSWMNRNRVLHPNGGPNWVSVPLANSSISITSAQARVADLAGTARSVLGKLSHYRRKAPHYEAVVELVGRAFALPADDSSLVHLNLAGLREVCSYLELPFAPRICSELALDLPTGLAPGDWALEIATRLGADSYLNPLGGRALFDPARYAARGVQLEFLQMPSFSYTSGPWEPVPDLSIIDVLMWNEPARVRQVLLETAHRMPAGELVTG
jgi:hypothetical protein